MLKTLGVGVLVLGLGMLAWAAPEPARGERPQKDAAQKDGDARGAEQAARIAAEKEALAKKEAEAKAAAEKEGGDKKAAAEKEAEKKKAAQAQQRVAQIRQNIKANRDAQRQNIKNMPDGGTFKMSDLVRFRLTNGRIEAQWTGNAFPNGQAKRIKIEGSSAMWTVHQFSHPQHSFFNLSCYDFDAPLDEFWCVTINVQQRPMTTLYINAQGNENCEVQYLNFQQANNMVHLNGNDTMRQRFQHQAPDLARLRAENPDLFRRLLVPLLRKATCQPLFKPGAGDVYRVFAEIPADSGMLAKVHAILPELVAGDAEDRQKASQKLVALGGPGVLAALRISPDMLLPEQACRLQDLVTLNTRILIEDPSEVARDTHFMLECLEYDDLQVRQSAKAALEKLLGKPVSYDVNLPAEKRAVAVDALRTKIAREARKDAVAPKKADDPPQPAPQLLPGRVRLHVAQ